MIDLTQVESPVKKLDIPPYWDENNVAKILLTYSAEMAFQSCGWRYHTRTFRQLRPTFKSEALTLGSTFHNGIEEYYRHNSSPLDDNALLLAMNKVDLDMGMVETGKDAMIKGMIKAFIRWTSKKSKFKVTDQEVQFLHKMPDAPDFEHDGIKYEFYLSGKCDAEMERNDGSFWMGEWKTCTNFQDFVNKIRVDDQPWQYMLLYYMKHGKFPDGVVYRLAKKLAIRIKKAETVDEFRDRYLAEYEENWEQNVFEEQVPFDPYRLDTHIDHLNQMAINIRQSIINNIWPRNRNSCFMYNSACGYMPLCGARDKCSFDVISGQSYEYHRANEELDTPTTDE